MGTKTILCWVIWIFFLTGSTADAATVKSGDHVSLDFTCRVKDGSVIMTTRSSVAEEKETKLSDLFIPLKSYTPFDMMANAAPAKTEWQDVFDGGFEGALTRQLGQAVVGMNEGEKKTVLLRDVDHADMPDFERYLKLAKVKENEKHFENSIKDIEHDFGIRPETGTVLYSENGITAVVESVGPETATVKILVEDGKIVDTPHGQGVLKDIDSEKYHIVLHPKVGQLIKNVYLIGRVVDIQDDMFVIDYANAFGGESLTCDICVNKIID